MLICQFEKCIYDFLHSFNYSCLGLDAGWRRSPPICLHTMRHSYKFIVWPFLIFVDLYDLLFITSNCLPFIFFFILFRYIVIRFFVFYYFYHNNSSSHSHSGRRRRNLFSRFIFVSCHLFCVMCFLFAAITNSLKSQRWQ